MRKIYKVSLWFSWWCTVHMGQVRWYFVFTLYMWQYYIRSEEKEIHFFEISKTLSWKRIPDIGIFRSLAIRKYNNISDYKGIFCAACPLRLASYSYMKRINPNGSSIMLHLFILLIHLTQYNIFYNGLARRDSTEYLTFHSLPTYISPVIQELKHLNSLRQSDAYIRW